MIFNKKTFIFGICIILSVSLILILVVLPAISIPKTEIVQFSCSQLQYTPSWIQDGKIISTGYIQGVKVEDLINEKISFYWVDSCHWCHKQIDEWGSEWETYIESGFTMECKFGR